MSKKFFNLDVTFQVEDITIGPLLVQRLLTEIGVRPVQQLATRFYEPNGDHYGNAISSSQLASQASNYLPPAAPPPETAKDQVAAAPATKPGRGKKVETPPADAPAASPAAAQTTLTDAAADEAMEKAIADGKAKDAAAATTPTVHLGDKQAELRLACVDKIKADGSKRGAVQALILEYSSNKEQPAVSSVPADKIQAAIDAVAKL